MEHEPSSPAPSSSPSEESSSPSKRVWPFHSAEEVRQAAKKYGERLTKPFQRAQILERLRVSGPLAAEAAEELLNIFPRLEVSERHEILNLFDTILEQGGFLHHVADALARLLNDPNFALREHAVKILIKMGPGAEEATTRALGCTRHSVREIRLGAVKVLGAIGPVGGSPVVKRLLAMREATPSNDKEMIEAIDQALQAVQRSEGVPFLPPSPTSSPAASGETPAHAMARKNRAERIGKVIQAVAHLAQAYKREEPFPTSLPMIEAFDPVEQMHGILACLRASDPNVRIAAIKLLRQGLAKHLPNLKILAMVYKDEQDLEVQKYLSDLIKTIATLVTSHSSS